MPQLSRVRSWHSSEGREGRAIPRCPGSSDVDLFGYGVVDLNAEECSLLRRLSGPRCRDPKSSARLFQVFSGTSLKCPLTGHRRLPQVPPAYLDIPILGQLPPAQLLLGDALEPGAL
jgi:hypothetical protein